MEDFEDEISDWFLLRGSGYLGYVDSNQGYNPYKWVICPLTRDIYLHITSYQVSWTSKYVCLLAGKFSCLIELYQVDNKHDPIVVGLSLFLWCKFLGKGDSVV